MSTITAFKDAVLLYGGNEVDDIASDNNAFLSWVCQALVNRHTEVCALSNKWAKTTNTFSAKGYEMDVPVDWDRTSEMVVYSDPDYQCADDSWQYQFGVIRFLSERSASQKYYIRYRKQASVYTSMSDTFVETANPRLNKILMDEVIGLFLQSEEDLEMSSAMTNVFNNADKNS